MDNEETQRKVKELYEKYPYPSRENPSKEDAIYFAKWAAKIIEKEKEYWNGKKVLELGCGTGELACGIALCGAKVTAIDFSSNSIKKAKQNSKKFSIEKNTRFILKNILELKENEFGKKFDAVIALGSMHHTTNAKKAFTLACKMLKPRGIIIIGLYNKYSRAKHRVKRVLLKMLAGKNIEKRIDYGIKIFGSTGNRTKDADKYGQIHETYHSVLEVLNWFKKEKIEFISSKPKFNTPILDEIKWLIEKKEAFFVMAGKKAS
jgi:2-polyprenyl-3-methyl-5-hydroxy-6-metoxy-1,4-benzoquinol methylase